MPTLTPEIRAIRDAAAADARWWASRARPAVARLIEALTDGLWNPAHTVARALRAADIGDHNAGAWMRADVGMRPKELLLRTRLGAAVRIMALPDAPPLPDVATLAGFGSYPTFRRLCHRRFGRAPRQLRRELRRAADP